MESAITKHEIARRRLLAAGMAGLLCVTAACTSSTTASSAVRAATSTASAEAPASPTLISAPDTCDPHQAEPVIVNGTALYCEEAQATGGVNVLDDYTDASGLNKRLDLGTTVLVRCLAEGPAEAAPSAASNPDKPGVAEWYQLEQPVTGFAASNAFWNVQAYDIPFGDQPTFDERVPVCP